MPALGPQCNDRHQSTLPNRSQVRCADPRELVSVLGAGPDTQSGGGKHSCPRRTHRQRMPLGAVLVGALETTEEDLEAALPNLAQRIDKLSKKGKCKGLVLWSQLTAHRLWRGELSVGGGTESALSLHNQARQAWAKLVMKALKPWKPSVKVFFLTPEVINMAVMMLKPAKDDVNVAFPPKPNRHIKLWGLADSYWAFHGITKLPAYYLSQELDGMQCDGLHFGSSYDRMHDGCGVCAHATCTCAYPHPLPCIPSPL